MLKAIVLIYSCFLLFISFLGCANDISDTEESCLGEKKFEIACIEIFQPVCGCDGKTYSNSCVAGVEGVLRWEAGECSQK
ncbi:MAG: hypothetical protein ACPHL7_06145 [Flavobacteriaceae bacterium]